MKIPRPPHAQQGWDNDCPAPGCSCSCVITDGVGHGVGQQQRPGYPDLPREYHLGRRAPRWCVSWKADMRGGTATATRAPGSAGTTCSSPRPTVSELRKSHGKSRGPRGHRTVLKCACACAQEPCPARPLRVAHIWPSTWQSDRGCPRSIQGARGIGCSREGVTGPPAPAHAVAGRPRIPRPDAPAPPLAPLTQDAASRSSR